MFGQNICGIYLLENSIAFAKLRLSLLNDCPALRFVSLFFDKFFAEFPCDDSAMASDGQAVAKWLFTSHPNNVPKVLKCDFNAFKYVRWDWPSRIENFKTAFALASSPANFIVDIWFRSPSFSALFCPLNFNELTREQLALKRTDHSNCFDLEAEN